MSNFLIFIFELSLIELIEIEVTLMLLRVTVLTAEDILTATLNASKADLLFTIPASSFVLLLIGY